MVDHADAVHRLRDRGRIGQAAFDEFGSGVEVRQIRPEAGAEVVEHANGPAATYQFFREVRPDEPRSAGDERKLVARAIFREVRGRGKFIVLEWSVSTPG